MRVGVDLDGVIYKWEPTARFLLNHYFGYKLWASTEWDYIERSVKKEHWNWLWKEGIEKHGLFRHGDSYKGAYEGLEELHRQGNELVIITSRPKKALEDTINWIGFHRIPATEIHVLGTKPKSSVPCDVYVDDSPDVLAELDRNRPEALILIWTQPWNLQVPNQSEHVQRVYQWGEVLRWTRMLKDAQEVEVS